MYKEVGNRLISFRKSKGYGKQSDFLTAILAVVKTGISQGNLSHWETGKYKPEYENLLLIKRAFPDLDIEYILTGKKSEHPSEINKLMDETKDMTDDEVKKHPLYIKLWDKYTILLEKNNNLK